MSQTGERVDELLENTDHNPEGERILINMFEGCTYYNKSFNFITAHEIGQYFAADFLKEEMLIHSLKMNKLGKQQI